MIEIEAFILIGGMSSRFGCDKAFFKIGSETMAGRAARIVKQAGIGPITYVSSGSTQFSEDQLSLLEHPVVYDVIPGFGAWSGLHSSLYYSKSEWVLVLACDLIGISASLIQLLSGFCANSFDAIVPRQLDRRIQPLCSFYHCQSVNSIVAKTIGTGSRPPGLEALFTQIRTRVVDPDKYAALLKSQDFFTNANTPAQVL